MSSLRGIGTKWGNSQTASVQDVGRRTPPHCSGYLRNRTRVNIYPPSHIRMVSEVSILSRPWLQPTLGFEHRGQSPRRSSVTHNRPRSRRMTSLRTICESEDCHELTGIYINDALPKGDLELRGKTAGASGHQRIVRNSTTASTRVTTDSDFSQQVDRDDESCRADLMAKTRHERQR
jgi:hypothetical protein